MESYPPFTNKLSTEQAKDLQVQVALYLTEVSASLRSSPPRIKELDWVGLTYTIKTNTQAGLI